MSTYHHRDRGDPPALLHAGLEVPHLAQGLLVDSLELADLCPQLLLDLLHSRVVL